MHRSRLRLTVLALTLPLAGTLVFGWLLLRENGERVRERAAAALNRRLQEMEGRYAGAQDAWKAELEALLSSLEEDPNPDLLRSAADGAPLVRTAVLLDGAGTLLFPDAESASLREREFLVRSSALLEDPWVPPRPEAGYGPGAWQRFYWRDGLQLLYWKALPDGRGYLLLEIERSALLADLAARLGAAPVPEGAEGHSVVLRDELGKVFLSWGKPAGRDTVVSNLALSGALQAWQFTWAAPLSAVPGRGDLRLLLGLLLGLGAAGSAALVLSLVRRLDRDIREAGRRVSFVNQVSHELKTPLTNIRLYAELLERDLSGGEEDARARRYLGIILRECGRLSRLIHNVLTFTRRRDARPGEAIPALHARSESPDRLAERCLEGFREGFEEKGIRIDLDLDCPGELRLDADAFEQMLGNLLSNAEKYGCRPTVDGEAAPAPWIGIRTREETGGVLVEVLDGGPGLPASAAGRAFQPFQRFHTSHTDAQGGAGLGLAIVRDLARLHGGDAWYADRSGGGACFSFRIKELP